MTPDHHDAVDSDLVVTRPARPGQWVAVALLVLLGALVLRSMATNERFQWDLVFEWFVSPRILHGLVNTLHLTAVSMAIGIVLGTVLAVMRQSTNSVIGGVAWIYIWLFRGTPVFVQLLMWGSISALYPVIAFGIPFGPDLVRFNANDLITPYMAAILGLGLNEAAYMAEIVRGGLKSVDSGQIEASAALGMNRSLTLRRVVLPQAMRVIIPPTGNEVIGMLKSSSLVAVLAYADLLYSAQLIYSVNYQVMPLLFTAALWYLIVSSVLSLAQYFVERHFGRSERSSARYAHRGG